MQTETTPAVTVNPAPLPSVKPARAQPASSFDPYSADLPSDAPTTPAPVPAQSSAQNDGGQTGGSSGEGPSDENAISCEEIRDFVARNAEDADESAADLNAAMLAQIDDKPEHCTQER